MDFISTAPFKSPNLPGLRPFSWKPCALLHNIFAVSQERDLSVLNTLLLESTSYEKELLQSMPKGPIATIEERAEQLSLLSGLIDQIHLHLFSTKPWARELNFLKAAPLASSSAEIHRKALQESMRHLDPSSKTPTAVTEWSKTLIFQKERLLNYLTLEETRQFSIETMQQISFLWHKQKNNINLLKREQFNLSCLILIRLLKITISQQMHELNSLSIAAQNPPKLAYQDLRSLSSSYREKEPALFGWESASEKDFEKLPFEEEAPDSLIEKEQLDPAIHERFSCKLALEHLLSIAAEKNFSRLERLLLLTDQEESRLRAKLLKADLKKIKEQAHQIKDLLEMTDSIFERCQQLCNKDCTDQIKGKPYTKFNLWSLVPIFSLTKKENAVFSEIKTEELPTLLQQLKLLDTADSKKMQHLISSLIEQLMLRWTKQKQEISRLKKEQFYLAHVNMLKLLKTTLMHQMKMVAY